VLCPLCVVQACIVRDRVCVRARASVSYSGSGARLGARGAVARVRCGVCAAWSLESCAEEEQAGNCFGGSACVCGGERDSLPFFVFFWPSRSGSLSSRRGPGTRSAGTGRTSESDPTRPHGRMRMSHVTPSPGDPSPDRTAETRAARPARRGRGWGPVVPQGGDLYAVSLCLRVLKLGHEKQGPRRVIARID
jgi:hypothetical protein